ncbi:MAG: hypothetical protein V2I47_05235 [Bacteroidales bacterium]|jgi:hypothetical protein|nr:hypothetical protein [Bacteroidales bacterium]
MDVSPLCLINVFLAILALGLYIVGSHKLYRYRSKYLLYLGLAIGIDILTASLASLRITPTVQLESMVTVPWHSILFKVHVIFSMIGFCGFILLFLYLLFQKSTKYSVQIRKWQFLGLLPVWIIGESIALTNSLMKIFFGMRLFDMV